MIMDRSERPRRGTRTAGVAVAALVLGAASVTGASLVTERAGAAPNPIGRGESSATITLAARDGSYQVRKTQDAELLDDKYDLTFESAMHDGFRAPDDDEPGAPPYLRPEYVLDEVTFDGAPAASDFDREGHLLSVAAGGDVAEGEHEARFTYTVNGAALPTDDGYEVYVRAGDLPSNERLVIDGSALAHSEITGLRCQYRPIPEPCGERIDADQWHPGEAPGEVIIIEVDGPSDALVEPVLDRG
ncbi:MAG: hypothetical protein ACTH2Q_07310 [Propionibacteriaceae bacterium]